MLSNDFILNIWYNKLYLCNKEGGITHLPNCSTTGCFTIFLSYPQDENKQLPSSMPKKSSKPRLSTGKDRSVDSAVDKQRQEARKRLMAAKRAASVRQNSATESADSIEIYVPEAQTRLWGRTSTNHQGTAPDPFRLSSTPSQTDLNTDYNGCTEADPSSQHSWWQKRGDHRATHTDLHSPAMGLNHPDRCLMLLLFPLLLLLLRL